MAGNTLLLAKLLVVTLITAGVHRTFSAPFHPAIPAFGFIAAVPGFGRIAGAVFFISAALVLLNRFVRASSAVAGATLLAGQAASLSAVRSEVALAGCLLLLCSLHEPKARPRLVRAFVIALLGAVAFGQLADSAWRDGSIVGGWIETGHLHPIVEIVARGLPFLPWHLIISWLIILGELSLAVGLALPNRSRILIWSGCVSLLGILFIVDSAETSAFVVTLGIAMISFVDWPREHISATWPRACGLPTWLRIALDRQDWDDRIDWPMPEDPDGILRVQIDDRTFHGARGLTTLLLYSPAFHVTVVTAFWLPHLILPASIASVVQVVVGVPLLAVFIRPRYLQMRARLVQSIQGKEANPEAPIVASEQGDRESSRASPET